MKKTGPNLWLSCEEIRDKWLVDHWITVMNVPWKDSPGACLRCHTM